MQTLRPSTMADATLRQVVRKIDEISSLPDVAFRVLQVANDPDSGTSDLKDVLEGDPALSARLLRYINSSAFSLRTKISDLQQAVTYLGTSQIRKLALTGSVSQLFRTKGGIGPYRRSELWRHMVSVGLCARLIGQRLERPDAEDLYLAGLLHDIGIILEDEHVHQRFCKVVQALAPGKTLVETEQTHLGFDHTMLGEKVADRWGFPELIKTCIRGHHGGTAGEEPDAWQLACVRIANAICTMKGIPSVGLRLVKVSKNSLRTLALKTEDLVVVARNLDDEIARHASLFEL